MKKSKPKKFHSYIRSKRIETGVSLRKCAQWLGVSATYLSEVERGNRPALTGLHLERLKNILDLSLEEEYCLYDLAAESRNENTPNDIAEYLNKNPNAKLAIREARINGLTDIDWKKVIHAFADQ